MRANSYTLIYSYPDDHHVNKIYIDFTLLICHMHQYSNVIYRCYEYVIEKLALKQSTFMRVRLGKLPTQDGISINDGNSIIYHDGNSITSKTPMENPSFVVT